MVSFQRTEEEGDEDEEEDDEDEDDVKEEYNGDAVAGKPCFCSFDSCLGFGFFGSLQPHILLRLTPHKRIYNFQIPKTTHSNGLKR